MKKRQQGLTTVETAIGAALMLIILFGTIEVARAIFVWNFLDEVTRRGARIAAVCPVDHLGVAKAAIFADPKGGSDDSPHVKGLSTSDINIDYLDANDNSIKVFEDIRFVRASIPSFQLPLLFYNKVTLPTPEFRTILPSESLGYNPDSGAVVCECFDTQGLLGGDGCGT